MVSELSYRGGVYSPETSETSYGAISIYMSEVVYLFVIMCFYHVRRPCPGACRDIFIKLLNVLQADSCLMT